MNFGDCMRGDGVSMLAEFFVHPGDLEQEKNAVDPAAVVACQVVPFVSLA